MYQFARYTLAATVILAAYLAVMLAFVIPYLWVGAVIALFWAAKKKTHELTSHGTARWADTNDLEGMTDE